MNNSYISRRATLASLAAAAALTCLGGNALAQNAYPNKPVQLMIGSATGGGTDAIGRVLADALTASLKQPFVPVNRAGASGSIATEMLARSPADGYTLLVLQNGHSVNPATMKKLPYDTFNDFTPISPLGRSPLVLVGGAQTSVKNVKELTELGKRTPASMTFGSAEASTRLATEMLSGATGLPMVSVNYKGTGPAMTDVAGGHVNFSVTTIASTLPMRGSGKVNYIAVLAPQRTSFLPEVPTLAEQGLPNIEASGWWGVIGPANMPKPVVQKLNAAIQAALNEPEVKKRLANLSIEPWLATSDEFDKFIRREVDLNLKLARKAGLEPE
jgi:tripartite-type tricarboxylate transporter receptor subunit TctC